MLIRLYFALTLLLASQWKCSTSFPLTPVFSLKNNLLISTNLHLRFPDDNDSSGDDLGDGFFDVDGARELFEHLVDAEDACAVMPPRPRLQSPMYNPSSTPAIPELDVQLPPPRPLTAIERERREAELQFLGSLAQGDDSLSDLTRLWFGERGVKPAAKLMKAKELIDEGPTGWFEAESILGALIEDHGIYWPEPVYWLSKLYYLQRKFKEAETLCQVVLSLKPWHFGALRNLVMVYEAQSQSEKARLWAATRLPPFSPAGSNRRRIAWTNQALQSAQKSMEASENLVQTLFGELDDHARQSRDRDMNSWQ